MRRKSGSAFDRVKACLENKTKPDRRDLMEIKYRADRTREQGVELSPYMVSLMRLEGKI